MASLCKLIIGLALGLFIISCASVPITSMPKLMRLDPETMDFAQLEMATRINDGIKLIDDSVKLTMMVKTKTTGDVFKQDLIFSHSAELTNYLKKQQKRGTQIIRYKLSTKEAVKADNLRKKILELKNKNPRQNIMTFTASSKFCKKTGSDISVVNFTSYLRTAPDKEFFKLFKENSIKIDGAEKIPLCK